MKGSFVFLVMVLAAASAFGAQSVSFRAGAEEIVLSNDLCRIVWKKTAQGWSGESQIKAKGKWKTIGLDGMPDQGPYAVLEQRHDPANDVYAVQDFADKFKPARAYARPWKQTPARVLSAYPPAASRPQVIRLSPGEVEIAWDFPILDGGKQVWNINATFVMHAGDHHVTEIVRYKRLVAGDPVRIRRSWYIRGIPHDLIPSNVHATTQLAWRFNEGTFMVLATHDGPWTPYQGGAGLVNVTLGNDTQEPDDGKLQESPDQAIVYQAPPSMQTQGWVELRRGETYTLKHYILMHPEYPFKRAFLDYEHKLQPIEYLAPRYPWRYFLDKCVWTLRCTPDAFDDHGDWGLYWKCWYNLTDDPVVSQSSHAFVDKVHSLEWGASWDIWNAYFLLLYGRRYKDEWALERYKKLRNGIVIPKWQIEDPSSLLDGAYWMEMDEQGRFHISNWMHLRTPRVVWVCDAAKIGYFLTMLYQETGDEVLLEKAKKASDFLTRIQEENGDLKASVLSEDGSINWPTNLAGTSSAVMLWAKLYEVTKNPKYLAVARKAADYCIRTWLSNDRWQPFGGELDSHQRADHTTTMYATMAFAELALVSKEQRYLQATIDTANHLVAGQLRYDINWSYYRKEGRWNGSDVKTQGSLQGTVRPECTYAMYMAWKATGDPLYRYSMEQHTNWMTHMQFDNPDSPKTFGGGHEGMHIPLDNMNGFGANFWPETVGQGVAAIKIMNDDDLKAGQ